MGALLALGSSLSWGVADFLGGVSARRAGPIQVLLISYPAGAIVLTLMARFLINGSYSLGVLWWGVAAGFIGSAAIGLLLSLIHISEPTRPY